MYMSQYPKKYIHKQHTTLEHTKPEVVAHNKRSKKSGCYTKIRSNQTHQNIPEQTSSQPSRDQIRQAQTDTYLTCMHIICFSLFQPQFLNGMIKKNRNNKHDMVRTENYYHSRTIVTNNEPLHTRKRE